MIYGQVVSSIVVLVGLILLVMALCRAGVLSESQGPLFSSLVTKVTLPALIFGSLARTPISWEYAVLALFMFGAELVSLALAWVAAKALRLPDKQAGALLLTASFGSSALLGYALISEVFPGNVLAITEAVAISELGVGPALFTVGVMVALYYGSGGAGTTGRFKAALGFFRSPIFLAVVAGLVWSGLKLPTDAPLIKPFFHALHTLGQANTFLVALTVGVLLRLEGLAAAAIPALVAGVIKLIAKPVMVWLPAETLHLTAQASQVLVLEAAMPSALLTVVLCSQYGCDARLASRIAFATALGSMVTVLVMFRLLAG